MLIAYLAVLCSAVSYGLAAVLQSIGAKRIEPGAGVGLRSLARVATQLPYLIGLGLDGFGWLLSLVALSQLPLFVVQAVVAGAIGFVVLFAAIFERTRPTMRQVGFIAVLFLGLAGLALSGAPETAARTTATFTILMWIGAVMVGLTGFIAPRHMGAARATALLGALAGLCFGGTALCARSLIGELSLGDVADPLLWAMVVLGALGFVFYTAALQRGSATVATAWMFTTETVVPALIGLSVLGDAARNGFAGVAAVSFVVTVGAAVGLTLVSPPMETDSTGAR